MLDRRNEEINLLRSQYGDLEVGPNGDWIIVRRWALPPGWNKDETQVLVFIPPGYPPTPPDNFYTDHDLRLKDGRRPGNTSENQRKIDRTWLMFSYHVDASEWTPHANLLNGHNMMTFLQGVSKRLQEAS